MKIDLWFETKTRLLSNNVRDQVSKVFCNISFLEETKEWSRIWNAFVDTGAHTTLIPEYIWKRLYYEPLSESLFLGVKSNLLCSIPCKVAKVYTLLIDEKNHTKPFIINAYLAKSNDVPLILGVSTSLDNFDLVIKYREGKGYLENHE